MPLLNWEPKYSVSVSEFDIHHKKLIEIINTLHDAMKVGKGRDILADILKQLIGYTQFHFAAEEKVMTQQTYPGLAAHQTQHQNLVKKVVEFQKGFLDGKTMISGEIMQFLNSWLVNHIMDIDKQYGPYLNAKGVK